MPAIDGSIRPLPWRLKFTEDMDSSTADESISFNTLTDWSTTDSDERVDIVLNLSLNEYVAIANTIDVGRDIAYGDNSIAIWWLWVRSLQDMSICDAIIACINDPDSGVAQKILETLTLTTGSDETENGQSQADLELGGDENPTCSSDIHWGGLESVIERANQNNIDSLERLEVATNDFEFVAEVIIAKVVALLF